MINKLRVTFFCSLLYYALWLACNVSPLSQPMMFTHSRVFPHKTVFATFAYFDWSLCCPEWLSWFCFCNTIKNHCSKATWFPRCKIFIHPCMFHTYVYVITFYQCQGFILNLPTDIMKLKTLKGLALQDILTEVHTYVHRGQSLLTKVSIKYSNCHPVSISVNNWITK